MRVQNPGADHTIDNQQVSSLNANAYFWGGDGTGWTGINGSFVVVSDPPSPTLVPYPYAGLYVNNGVTPGFMSEQNGLFIATPFQQYQVVAWVYPTSTSVTLGFNWFNGGLGAVTGPANTTFGLTANVWSRIMTTIVAPATTVYGCPIVGPSAADGSSLWAEAIIVTAVSATSGWTDLRALANSFVGTISGQYPPQCRLNNDGTVEVAGFVQFPPSGGPNFNGVTFATLPAGMRPNSNAGHRWPITLSTNALLQVSGTVFTPNVAVDTSGNLTFHNCPVSGMASNLASIAGRFPLDSSGLILT